MCSRFLENSNETTLLLLYSFFSYAYCCWFTWNVFDVIVYCVHLVICAFAYISIPLFLMLIAVGLLGTCSMWLCIVCTLLFVRSHTYLYLFLSCLLLLIYMERVRCNCVLCTHCYLCVRLLIYTFFSHAFCCWFTWNVFDVIVSVYLCRVLDCFHFRNNILKI